ncbi:MAG: RICIN domain-containing protein [Pseudonocardiaceae bacterium]
MAKDHPKVRHGVLSSSTMHRILSGQQDLAFAHDPARFVEALVTTLGVDATPWVEVVNKLLVAAREPLTEPDPTADLSAVPADSSSPLAWWRPLVISRKLRVIAAGLVLLTAGLVTSAVVTEETPAPEVDYTRPAVIEVGDTGLKLAVDQNSDQPGGRGVVLDSAKAATVSWDLVAPYRDNPAFRQLRPTGKLLMCLEVDDGSFDERAAVQQWGCDGEQHQYWKVLPGSSGLVRFINLRSGQCLSVASAKPEAGMQVVQRECGEQQQAQQWRVVAADPPAASSSAPTPLAPAAVGPDPAEYPDGGKDQPCDGDGMQGLPASSTPWSDPPELVRDKGTTGGQITLGPGAAGAVYLHRANRTNNNGIKETFYWAEGFVKFTPKQFAMALQWTKLPGPGGWHTCSIVLTKEYERLPTVALPRDANNDENRDVAFRVCLSYQPEHSTHRVVDCSERYGF